MVFYKKLNDFQETFFDIFIYFSYILIVVSFFDYKVNKEKMNIYLYLYYLYVLCLIFCSLQT